MPKAYNFYFPNVDTHTHTKAKVTQKSSFLLILELLKLKASTVDNFFFIRSLCLLKSNKENKRFKVKYQFNKCVCATNEIRIYVRGKKAYDAGNKVNNNNFSFFLNSTDYN